ncbi:MAG: hypothetical protein CUN51_03350 [Candidatus Thermofonsia Clade 1 bacterium]|uniref:B box-type domain-containing protein n=1 Tax=Candidatus Thermofonsia Clade 1 bacterium TaxID=2364210 RepID=A0A2M8P1G2_9CHLR|nr:MAG: hypothetical protein CUN51_03350 [Candidatus Thermofonsia Clade 1 bacterium]
MNQAPNYAPVDEKTFCAAHPDVETALRCNRCGRYMCPRCAVRTEVGYRCRECVYQQQGRFFKATERQQIVSIAVVFALGLVAGLIIPRLFLLGALFFSLPAGVAIGELAFRAAGRQRGRYVPQIAVAAVILAALIVNSGEIGEILRLIETADRLPRGVDIGAVVLQRLLPIGVYAGLCSLAVYGRLR